MAIIRHASPFNDASPTAQAPPQALTKRDVRRNRIVEKLQIMANSFATNGHEHYRAQLQAIQVDMTLLIQADPYRTGEPLEDSHDEIRALIDNAMRGNPQGLPEDEAARNDFYSIAGKRYGEFVRNINDAIEARDAELTALHNNYESALVELEKTYQHRLHQAEEEHKALSATIRQRLTTTLTKRRAQLLRDKDQLDISDTNAMLMHPNQFSIGNNPGSPSHNGLNNNKRTRHLRHHRGVSPVPNTIDGSEIPKRKRKFGQAEDDGYGNDSPVHLAAGARSPLKDSRAQKEYAQFEAPVYSVEKIFTEKELAMATETAKRATYQYFYMPQQPAPEPAGHSNGTAQSSVDGEILETAEALAVGDEAMIEGSSHAVAQSPAPAAAAEMERTASHQVLTRNGAKKDPLAALADLATAQSNSSGAALRMNPFTPVAPPYHAVTRSEKSGAPAPPGVGALDIENDFEMMRRAGADVPADSSSAPAENGTGGNHYVNNTNHQTDAATVNRADAGLGAAEEAAEMRRQLLDQALGRTTIQAPYRLPQLESGPGALIGPSVDREPRTAFAPALPVAVQIESRLRGVNAAAAGGGGSMAAALSGRLGAGLGLGAEPMSRTTSAGGFSEIGEGPMAAAVVPAPSGRRGGRGRLV